MEVHLIRRQWLMIDELGHGDGGELMLNEVLLLWLLMLLLLLWLELLELDLQPGGSCCVL